MKILETFRDAIQGLDNFIPTERKVEAVRILLGLGFDYVDAGSFVSPKLVPQFADMDAVVDGIGHACSGSQLFVLAGNEEGALRACRHDQVDAIGFPFSTSETFLRKNINAGFEEAWCRLEAIRSVCEEYDRKLMVYLAMAFGNPYGDPVSARVCLDLAGRLATLGVTSIHLSDITGVATPRQVGTYYRSLTREHPGIEFGIHLHIKDESWRKLLAAAVDGGCTLFDGVTGGLGGCPMTGYEMLRNLPTSSILEFAAEEGIRVNVDTGRFHDAQDRIMALIGA